MTDVVRRILSVIEYAACSPFRGARLGSVRLHPADLLDLRRLQEDVRLTSWLRELEHELPIEADDTLPPGFGEIAVNPGRADEMRVRFFLARRCPCGQPVEDNDDHPPFHFTAYCEVCSRARRPQMYPESTQEA